MRLQPVLVGAIFAQRGWGSWGHTHERGRHMAEVESRARAYRLPPVRWPEGWPNNTLAAMRATLWAGERGAGGRFARAAFTAAFAEGKDLSDLDAVREVSAAVGLDADETTLAVADPRIKAELKRVTDEAIADGIGGVPCTRVDGRVFYGDDRLEQAASAA